MTRQAVFEDEPRQMLGVVDVKRGFEGSRIGEGRGVEVNLTGIAVGLEGHGCSAGRAETAADARGGAVGFGWCTGPLEAVQRDAEEGGDRGCGLTPATFAVAMAGPGFGALDAVAYGAAQAVAGSDHGISSSYRQGMG